MQNSSTKQTQKDEVVCYSKAFGNTESLNILDEDSSLLDAEARRRLWC